MTPSNPQKCSLSQSLSVCALPTEILLQIMLQLDYRSLVRPRPQLIDRHFRDLRRNQELQTSTRRREFSDIGENFQD